MAAVRVDLTAARYGLSTFDYHVSPLVPSRRDGEGHTHHSGDVKDASCEQPKQ